MDTRMDNLSDSFRGELDSVTSTDSLQLITDEFHLRHLSTPDVSNIELSKRVALLELENERLRVDLENVRIELNARVAANQGLKGKVTELYVEVQLVLTEKQKLQHNLSDMASRLSTAEASTKWYQSVVHNIKAGKKALQTEIDMYQGILKQRQNTISKLTDKYKELTNEYTGINHKHLQEKQELQNEIRNLQNMSLTNHELPIADTKCFSPDLSTKVETTEEELRDTKAELKNTEQRLLGNEIAKMSMETVISKQRILISSLKENIQKSEIDKNDVADRLRKTQLEIEKLKSENESLQSALLCSKQEQNQIGDAIFTLKTQLAKMITQHKLLKSKNAESEEKLISMQNLISENKRLKTLSCEANSSLLKRLRQEKRKSMFLQKKLYEDKRKEQPNKQKNKNGASLRECLQCVLQGNKNLKDQIKTLTKSSDESIDEGYGDNSMLSSISVDIPSPIPMNSVLLNTVSNILSNSKDLFTPVQEEINKLQIKLERLRDKDILMQQ